MHFSMIFQNLVSFQNLAKIVKPSVFSKSDENLVIKETPLVFKDRQVVTKFSKLGDFWETWWKPGDFLKNHQVFTRFSKFTRRSVLRV